MTDQFLYETLSPLLIIITISFLSAEFIGRRKHIGRGYSFFMMLAIIPGIIGLIFSPSAIKQPTKANNLYNFFGCLLVVCSILTIFSNINNLTFIHVFTGVSLISSAIYCFELAKGKIINKEPKYYFENQTTNLSTEKNVKQVKTSLDNTISNLTDLKNKGILTEEEYKQKTEKIQGEKDEQDLKDSIEYKQLKSLFDSGVLTKEEFESKLLKIEESITLFKVEGCYIVDSNKLYFNTNGTFKIEYENKKINEGAWMMIDEKTIKIKLNSLETIFKNVNPIIGGFSYINGKTSFIAKKCI